MPYDGLVMAAVSNELNQLLIGARIEKIYQPLREEIILTASKPGQRYRLLISANATQARVHLTDFAKPNPASPPMFCMVLRKHLENSRILEIKQAGLERVLQIKIDTRDELGHPAVKTLVVEVMGKHSNIILLNNETNTIIDGIKRYSHAVSRHREVLPGRKYIAPPAQGKTSPVNITEEQFLELITSKSLDSKLTNILLKTFDGFSPLMCKEVVYRTGLPLNTVLNHCGQYELLLLWQHFSTISTALGNSRFKPTLVFKHNGTPLDYAAYELTQYHGLSMQSGEINRLLDIFYTHQHYQQQLQAKGQSILTVINRDISRLKNKLPKYKRSLQRANRGDDYRIFGELLTANMYRLERGMSEVELENFYTPNLELVTIPLESEKTPSQNAQAYFKKYNKAKNTLVAVRKQLAEAQRELAYLESVETAVTQCTTLEDIEDIHSELVKQGYLKKVTDKHKKREKRSAKPQPLRFTSTDGFTILVGKNNRQNDYLTTRLANPEDLWLHTKEIPGSHVVIRNNGQEVPPDTLEQSALLAAYHSKARHSNKVPVDYTLIKHVNKPNGAKPGMVIYVNQQTIYVTPDEEVVWKLKSSKNN